MRFQGAVPWREKTNIVLYRFSIHPLVPVISSYFSQQTFSIVVNFVGHFEEKLRTHGFTRFVTTLWLLPTLKAQGSWSAIIP